MARGESVRGTKWIAMRREGCFQRKKHNSLNGYSWEYETVFWKRTSASSAYTPGSSVRRSVFSVSWKRSGTVPWEGQFLSNNGVRLYKEDLLFPKEEMVFYGLILWYPMRIPNVFLLEGSLVVFFGITSVSLKEEQVLFLQSSEWSSSG